MSLENNLIASIDIWSSKIRTIIWKFDEENKENFQVLWVGIVDSTAIRKGNILDMDEFKNNLDKSLEEAEKIAWEQVAWATISFNSSHLEVFETKWVVSVSGEEVGYDDIDRVMDMAKNGIDLSNKEILKVIPDYYTVDLESGIRSPIWMSARKLELNANIFAMNASMLNNIRKAVSDVWIEIYDIYPNLISAPEWILSKRQKELWVVVIDIWASTTGITVYEEGSLKFAKVIPVWAENVTNDVALWTRVSIDTAERLKLEYAEVTRDEEDFLSKEIDLKKVSKNEEWKVETDYLSKIVTARYEEIFNFIREELRYIWKDWMLPEWAIMVWSGAKMKGIVDLAKEILRLPVVVGTPIEKDSLTWTSISDPSFASVIWTLILANKYAEESLGFKMNFLDSIKKLFKKILPF